MADAATPRRRRSRRAKPTSARLRSKSNAIELEQLFVQAQSFKSLNEVSSQNFVLQLSFTANSQEAFTSLFAFTKDNNVLTSNNFNFSFPGCVAE